MYGEWNLWEEFQLGKTENWPLTQLDAQLMLQKAAEITRNYCDHLWNSFRDGSWTPTEDVNFNGNWASRVLDSFGNVALIFYTKKRSFVFLCYWDRKGSVPRRYWPVGNQTYWCGDRQVLEQIALCVNESKLEGSRHRQFCNGKPTFFTCYIALKFWQKAWKELNKIQVFD